MAQESKLSVVVDALTHFKHLLLPMTNQNPYLSEGTRQVLYLGVKYRSQEYVNNVHHRVLDE